MDFPASHVSFFLGGGKNVERDGSGGSMLVCCLLCFYVYHQHLFLAFAYILGDGSGDYFAKTFALIPMIEEGHTKALLIHFLKT